MDYLKKKKLWNQCHEFVVVPENKFNSVREVFLNLMRVEGPLALYKGVVPVMLRAFPANAACFTGFEMAKEFLDLLCPNV